MADARNFQADAPGAHADADAKAGTGSLGGAGCGCSQNLGDVPLPKVTFSTFILSLSSSALVHLGEVPNPETGQVTPSLSLAKHTIDVLEMLHQKTSACLDPDEERLLSGILYELRVKYVLKSR